MVKEFIVEKIIVEKFDETGNEDGTWKGYAATQDENPECYFPCMDKYTAEILCDYLNSHACLGSLVDDDLAEWSRCITKLTIREKQYFKLKEAYQSLSDKIIGETDFKTLYGRNNAEVRKEHVKKELIKEYEELKELEFDIDYLKRQIIFLKQLVHTKTVFMEVKR